MTTNQYNGAKNLLTPDNHALVLIDHQYPQLLSVTSHQPSTVSHNVTALAKAAKVFNVPTLLTTGVAKHQPLLKELQAVFPDQKPIDRTGLNSWDDQRVVDWVKQTGRKRLVIAGLWTEICLNLAVLSALGDGYHVYIVPDASGGAHRGEPRNGCPAYGAGGRHPHQHAGVSGRTPAGLGAPRNCPGSPQDFRRARAWLQQSHYLAAGYAGPEGRDPVGFLSNSLAEPCSQRRLRAPFARRARPTLWGRWVALVVGFGLGTHLRRRWARTRRSNTAAVLASAGGSVATTTSRSVGCRSRSVSVGKK